MRWKFQQEVGRLKVHRLLSIVMLLLANKRVGARELAERFEVSLRTIYRDLETLGGAGIPIVSFSGPNGGYEIMERYHIDRQIVTPEDLRSILTALNGLEASLKDPKLSDVIAKVGALITKAEQTKPEESRGRSAVQRQPVAGKKRGRRDDRLAAPGRAVPPGRPVPLRHRPRRRGGAGSGARRARLEGIRLVSARLVQAAPRLPDVPADPDPGS